MAEITHVDADHLYRLAARMDDAADHVATSDWPQLAPEALPGSVVSAATEAQPIARRVQEVAIGLRSWAAAARDAAGAFAGTDHANGARFGGP
ncbi:DUF7162 family protein [Mycobacterium sp. SMC-4]|uniref:DUF7162 family protein n=1 Tax=Mycobacterium sp. SMC-4 TaxID=2857059 RepID=UPI003CFE90BF